MLKNLGLYLTKKRVNVLWIALVLTLLPFVGIPTGWISMILVGLITLRNGPKEGFLVLLWIALPAVALSVWGYYNLLVSAILFRGLVIWGLALVLRRTASWSVVLQCVVLLGVFVIVYAHLTIPDLSGQWAQQLTVLWKELGQSLHWDPTSTQAKTLVQLVSQLATGIFVVALLGFDLLLILIARGWQALVYNPKGLSRELCEIRVSIGASILLLVCLIGAILGSALSRDLMPVMMLPFVLAGLSVLHVKLAFKKEIKVPLLIGMYLIFFLFMPYMAMLLAFVGLVDSWFDFRALRVIRAL